MAEESLTSQQHIAYSFKYDSAYRILAANGVWIALTPRGDVRLDFFVEGPEAPDLIVQGIDDKGNVGKILRQEPAVSVSAVRSMQAGVLISLKEAENLATVLSQQIKIWQEAINKAGTT